MTEQVFNVRLTVRAETPNEAHTRAGRIAEALRRFLELAGADVKVLPGASFAESPEKPWLRERAA